MLRKSRWKLHEYIDFPSELFDLATDPDERINRAEDPACANTVAAMRRELRRIVDPGAANRQTKADQRALIGKFERDKAFRIGTKDATPTPV
jgi:choline-sulfatase